MTRRPILTTLTLTGLLALTLLLAACNGPDARSFYDGYDQDIQMFRENYHPDARRTLHAADAYDPAERLFTKIDFVGMTPDEVVATLAEPVWRQHNGPADHPEQDMRWTYDLTNRWMDAKWAINFKDGKVISVEDLNVEPSEAKQLSSD